MSPRLSEASARQVRSYVALLRAINVGGRTVRMDELRKVFESLPLSNVRTFIASGNVIFEAGDRPAVELESTIEARLERALGYEVRTFLRSLDEMVAIARATPFPEDALDLASVYVAFLKDPLGPGVAKKVMALRTDLDDLHVRGREIYWLRRNVKERTGEPGPPLERVLTQPATTRNITTVRRIAAKYWP